MLSTHNYLDCLASENSRVWFGDCKVRDQFLVVHYAYINRFTPDMIWVYREDGKGYLIEIPPELRMLPSAVNFFRKVSFRILDIHHTQQDMW